MIYLALLAGLRGTYSAPRGMYPAPRGTVAGRYPRRQAPARRSSGRASSPVRRTLFHAPSFSAGVVMGAVVVLGAAYLPELLGGPARETATVPVAPADTRPTLTFEFDRLLRNSEVTADPEPYVSAPRVRRGPTTTIDAAEAAVGAAEAMVGAAEAASAAEPAGAVPPETFMLQAASFRSREDAERLRAALLLMDLPASTTTSSLSTGVWHRVTVGPFASRVQAERAMTRLREQNIAAIWTRS